MGVANTFASANAPAVQSTAITPSDSVNIAQVSRAITAVAAGNLQLTLQNDADGTSNVFYCAAGQVLSYAVKRVWATLTTATGIVTLN